MTEVQGKKSSRGNSSNKASHNSVDLKSVLLEVQPDSEEKRRRGSICISIRGKIEDMCRAGDVTPTCGATRARLALPPSTLRRIRMLRSASAAVDNIGKDGNSNKVKADAEKKWNCLRGLVKGAKRIFTVTREVQLYGYPPAYADEVLLADLMRASNKMARRRRRKEEEKKGYWFMIHPDNRLKSAWSVLLVFLLLYSVIINPLQIAFFSEGLVGWTIAECFVEVLFFIDIFVNMCSAYYDTDGKLVNSWRNVAERYLRGWFLLDLMACFPFSQIMSAAGMAKDVDDDSYLSQSVTSVFQLPRLYRMLKMIRLIKVFHSQGRNSVIRVFESAIHMNSGSEHAHNQDCSPGQTPHLYLDDDGVHAFLCVSVVLCDED